MRRIAFITLVCCMTSCVPYSFAPRIEGNKLVKAKKFNRDLKDLNGFVFQEMFDEGDFQRFLENRFGCIGHECTEKLPFTINDIEYFMQYYEPNKADRMLNLFSVFIDAALESNNIESDMDEDIILKDEFRYILLTVTDAEGRDCLSESYEHRSAVANYLRLMHHEYMNPAGSLTALPAQH